MLQIDESHTCVDKRKASAGWRCRRCFVQLPAVNPSQPLEPSAWNRSAQTTLLSGILRHTAAFGVVSSSVSHVLAPTRAATFCFAAFSSAFLLAVSLAFLVCGLGSGWWVACMEQSTGRICLAAASSNDTLYHRQEYLVRSRSCVDLFYLVSQTMSR